MPADLMLIAYDGSDNAKRAIQHAGRFLAANRAVVVTAWEPMVRQAARMSGLSGVMQPEWVPA
ncbi:universal stress protein, partial [Rhodococcus hoagii]|nr:universal stress protein [Prescottella equi]